MYQLTTVAHIDPSKLDEILEYARKVAEASRKQQGNVSYNFYCPEEGTDTFLITEAWETKEDWVRHFDAAHVPGDATYEFAAFFDTTFTREPEAYYGETLI